MKENTVTYKVYSSLKAAESYIARNLAHDDRIEVIQINDLFYVTGR